jgi:hypothetical protein
MYMIFAENYNGDIVHAITWNKGKMEGILHMKLTLKERNKTASKVWAEKIEKPETAI